MLWMKAFHIIAMVAWFGGLFYLPRLFVYHTQVATTDTINYDRFCTMERRLYWGIMTPSAIVTVLLGFGLVHMMHYSLTHPPRWLLIKFSLVGALLWYHALCGKKMSLFKKRQNPHSALYYRIFNEISVVLLIAIVLMVVLKPV